MSPTELEEFCESDFEFEDESDDFSLTNGKFLEVHFGEFIYLKFIFSEGLKKLPLDWKHLIAE
jgi:hypothetical protein